MKNLLLLIAVIFSMSLYSQRGTANVGKQYPEFKITTLDGKEISHKDLEGKITLFNFWFQACPPCVAEMDALEALYNKFKDDPSFLFISVSVDSPEITKQSIEKFNIPYAVCAVAKDEARILNFGNGFPTTIVTDRAGKVLYCKSGGPIDKQVAFKMLKPVEDLIQKSL